MFLSSSIVRIGASPNGKHLSCIFNIHYTVTRPAKQAAGKIPLRVHILKNNHRNRDQFQPSARTTTAVLVNFEQSKARNSAVCAQVCYSYTRENFLGGNTLFLMKDVVRDPNPVLRATAKKLTFPLTAEQKQLAHDLMEYLVISQDEEANAKYHLRPGVGLAAPQVDQSLAMTAVLIPDEEGDDGDKIFMKEVLVNPRVISNSVQNAALAEGEGCLSVDDEHPGYVVRHARVTIEYYNLDGEKKKIRLKNYPAIVCQHEIDHLNGILFYDHISKEHPLEMDPDGILLG
jgi:peptide deformylase